MRSAEASVVHAPQIAVFNSAIVPVFEKVTENMLSVTGLSLITIFSFFISSPIVAVAWGVAAAMNQLFVTFQNKSKVDFNG